MRRLTEFVGTLVCVGFAVILIRYGNQAAFGAALGIRLCLQTVIPSLFCFMVLTEFLVKSGFYRLLSAPLAPVCRHLFRLPEQLGSVVVLSWFGGFPMGAKSLSNLLEQGDIDPADAQRMMLYCCCAGPSFIITAVGRGMFGNPAAGYLLYGIQLLVSFCFAVVLGRIHTGTRSTAQLANPSKSLAVYRQSSRTPIGNAFVLSVNQSVLAMVQMCGFIVLFQAISALLEPILPQGIARCLLMGALEVTNGCKLASKLPMGLVYASCFLSFSGISVISQLVGILQNSSVAIKPFLLSRLLHAFCSGSLTLLYLRLFPQAAAVFSSCSQPVPLSDANTPALTFCLIMMSALLLWEIASVERSARAR